MPPKIVGLHLALANTSQHQGWRVTSTSCGRAYLVLVAEERAWRGTIHGRSKDERPARHWADIEWLYRALDEGHLVVKGRINNHERSL